MNSNTHLKDANQLENVPDNGDPPDLAKMKIATDLPSASSGFGNQQEIGLLLPCKTYKRSIKKKVDAKTDCRNLPSTTSVFGNQQEIGLLLPCKTYQRSIEKKVDAKADWINLPSTSSGFGYQQEKSLSSIEEKKVDAKTDWTNLPSTSSGLTNQQGNRSHPFVENYFDFSDEEAYDCFDQSISGDTFPGLQTTSGIGSIPEHDTESSLPDQPVKRNRGRPRKTQSAPKKVSTRVSTRIKKAPIKLDYEKEEKKVKSNNCWSKEETEQLLRGLEEFGDHNIKDIQRYVTTKSVYQIKSQLMRYEEIARNGVDKMLILGKKNPASATVDSLKKLKWWEAYCQDLQKNSHSRQFALSQFFSLASEYGKFPSVEESDGIDFRALYRFLHCMINGEPYFGMNDKTASVLYDVLKAFESSTHEWIQESDPTQYLIQSLNKIRKENDLEGKTYSRSKKEKDPSFVAVPSNPAAVINLPDMNPLGLPLNALKRPAERVTLVWKEKSSSKK